MNHLKSYKLFETEQLSSKLTVPKGTYLFHSTAEDFDSTKLHGGGYDSIIWTTEDSAISQTYIPQSGSTMYTSASHIAAPSEDPVIRSLQKQIGIDYDYDDIKFEDRKPVSWWAPKVFAKWDDLSWTDRENNKNKYVNDKLKDEMGYSIYQEDSGLNHGYAIKSNGGKAVRADFMMKGRLFVIIPQEDLSIYDMTYGGRIEGDLQDLDYHKVSFFKKLAEDGFDGVKINDFAQTKEFGNFGHTSIGLFKSGIDKCKWEVIPDVTYPKGFEQLANDRDWDSTEYKAYKKLMTIRESNSHKLFEFIVPKNMTWEEWKKMHKKGMTPAKYHKKNPKSRFKIVHGHKRGSIGKALPGAGDLSYEKASKMHAAIAMNESEAPVEDLVVYHGTDKKFDDFDFDKTAQGVVWFTDSKDSIKTGGHGGDGSKYILTRKITLDNPAGWDEYESKSIGELINDGYDGVVLPDDGKTDYIVFDPESIKE